MRVTDVAFCTVTVVVAVIPTPPAVAEMVFVSATVELKLNDATPLEPVFADAGVIVLPLPVELTETATPLTGLLASSRTVTLIVLLPFPAVISWGVAVIVEFATLGE